MQGYESILIYLEHGLRVWEGQATRESEPKDNYQDLDGIFEFIMRAMRKYIITGIKTLKLIFKRVIWLLGSEWLGKKGQPGTRETS